jgi:hypothetical protein
MPCGLVILQKCKDLRENCKTVQTQSLQKQKDNCNDSTMAYMLQLDPDPSKKNRRRTTLQTPIEFLHAHVIMVQNWMWRWRIVVHPMIAAGIATLQICFAISPSWWCGIEIRCAQFSLGDLLPQTSPPLRVYTILWNDLVTPLFWESRRLPL